jgi:hypothetical protein
MEFTEEIDPNAELMTFYEFYEEAVMGYLTDSDGHGYPSNGKMVNKEETVLPSEALLWKFNEPEYSHVLWFNK